MTYDDYCLDCVAYRLLSIDFRFRFSAKSHALLSVAHTVSAECVTSLSVYFRFWPKVKLPLSVDL